ncbi:MAG: WecB/TagA/CpsF family glycosyltransferase [Bacillota bacterium]|nr:WecB/TagA/CpsF family glycosyltransferase [Bacillota bacterium]
MRSKIMEKKVEILGLGVNDVTMEETVTFVADTVGQGGFARILTLNAEMAYLSYNDSQRKSLVNNAELVTPDGSGIMWAAERYGQPIRERVSGIDLTERLLSDSKAKGYKFYCLGAKEEILEAAVKNMETKYGAYIAGWHHGYFSLEESSDIAAKIKETGANILLVAMGFPRQDKWIEDHGKACGVNVAMGIGGSFDVLAGSVKRAPKIWQRMKMEWFYRLIKDPRRFKRVLNLPKFMQAVKRDVAKK